MESVHKGSSLEMNHPACWAIQTGSGDKQPKSPSAQRSLNFTLTSCTWPEIGVLAGCNSVSPLVSSHPSSAAPACDAIGRTRRPKAVLGHVVEQIHLPTDHHILRSIHLDLKVFWENDCGLSTGCTCQDPATPEDTNIFWA